MQEKYNLSSAFELIIYIYFAWNRLVGKYSCKSESHKKKFFDFLKIVIAMNTTDIKCQLLPHNSQILIFPLQSWKYGEDQSSCPHLTTK